MQDARRCPCSWCGVLQGGATARGFPQRKGGTCGSAPSPASIRLFLSAPFFKPMSWISSSFPQPVCYPCKVSQGGSVIASPPVGSSLYVQHSGYPCFKAARIKAGMCGLQPRRHRWVADSSLSLCPPQRAFVVCPPVSDGARDVATISIPWALGASRAYALKQPEMFSPSRKQSLICTSVSRSLIIDRGSFYRCFLVSGLLCFPGFPEGW